MKEDSAGDKALKQFADLMIQKIKEVEQDWKKPMVLSRKWRRDATKHRR